VRQVKPTIDQSCLSARSELLDVGITDFQDADAQTDCTRDLKSRILHKDNATTSTLVLLKRF
jgi:hypothetical protein